jgi:hypothetical protein
VYRQPSAASRRRSRKKAARQSAEGVPITSANAASDDVRDLEGACLYDKTGEESSADVADVADVAEAPATTGSPCVVCMEGSADWAVVPCGHKVLCEACSKLFRDPESKCPMCRQSVLLTIRIFE